MKNNDLMTCKEASIFLTVKESWIRRQTRLHQIPVVRLGAYCRYKKSSLERYIHEQEQNGAGDEIND